MVRKPQREPAHPKRAVAGESAAKRFAPEAARALQEAIEEAGGREVFFSGTLGPDGRVAEVKVRARGNANAVPALFESLGLREVVIHNHPSGNLEPSAPDLELAAMFSAHGHGVFIVDNDCAHVYVVVEPFIPEDKVRLDPSELGASFRPGSVLSKNLPHFEVRPQQRIMMESVAHAFNNDGIAVIEAPTGVGKTLAYLLPAVQWALKNKERVVISTRTINLQEQIVFKDIPVLERCVSDEFHACLVKGRGNYVCLRKLERFMAEATLFDDTDTKDQFDMLSEWIKHTRDGSLSDLPFVPERALWEQINSEADACGMGRCPRQKECFVSKARREVAKADLIVANHHILFSDIALKHEAGDFSSLAVLPAYKRVIFDEAHSIEDSATEYFGATATLGETMSTLWRFSHRERAQERGLIPLLRARLVKDCRNLDVRDFERIQGLLDQYLLPAVEAVRSGLSTAFGELRALTADKCRQIGRDIKWRLTEEVLQDVDLRRTHANYILPAVEEVRDLVRYASQLFALLEEIPANAEGEASPIGLEMMQLRAYAARIERIGNVLAEATSEELEENTVRWIEIDSKKEQYVKVVRCPLHVGNALSVRVYNNLASVVMTSATLAVDHSFAYLFDRLGLDEAGAGRIHTDILDSPFNFQQQALLCVPADVPEPSDREFLDDSVEMVRATLRITRGHAFVLFTSFYALDYTFRQLADELGTAGITPLRQGDATRTQLLDRFRADTASVLFATDSFWEGVDVAGDSLQCVILPKLPFRVPTEPLLEARAEAIEAAGGNAFMQYSVPQAVIKFRQGFGRLIRRRTDRGAVVVLDKRILTKFYGRTFIRSLPELRLVRGPRRGVLFALDQFFNPTPEEVSE